MPGRPWWQIAARDPMTAAILLLGLVGYAVYGLPLLDSDGALRLFEKLWDALLILLCGCAFLRKAGKPIRS